MKLEECKTFIVIIFRIMAPAKLRVLTSQESKLPELENIKTRKLLKIKVTIWLSSILACTHRKDLFFFLYIKEIWKFYNLNPGHPRTETEDSRERLEFSFLGDKTLTLRFVCISI